MFQPPKLQKASRIVRLFAMSKAPAGMKTKKHYELRLQRPDLPTFISAFLILYSSSAAILVFATTSSPFFGKQ